MAKARACDRTAGTVNLDASADDLKHWSPSLNAWSTAGRPFFCWFGTQPARMF
jgi:hypothetical protein